MLQRKKSAYPYVLKRPRHKVRTGKGQAELALAEDGKKITRGVLAVASEEMKERRNGAAVQRGWGID